MPSASAVSRRSACTTESAATTAGGSAMRRPREQQAELLGRPSRRAIHHPKSSATKV